MDWLSLGDYLPAYEQPFGGRGDKRIEESCVVVWKTASPQCPDKDFLRSPR